MIVTVTPNTSVDHVISVPSLVVGTTVRASGKTEGMGGKPTDVSWILGGLGTPSYALGFAAGNVGAQVETMLRGRGVTTDFTTVWGESRRNIVILSQSDSRQTTITVPSLEVHPEHVQDLYTRFEQILGDASCVVLGGTLPAGVPDEFYSKLIGLARSRGVPVILDTSEPHLRAGMEAGPTYVKPNLSELEAYLRHPLTSLAEVYAVACDLKARHGVSLVVSLGEHGGLAVLSDRAYYIPALNVDVKNAAGAGDGVLSGLAAALSRGGSPEDGLRLGFAIATAVLLQVGTAECDPIDVERFHTQVELVLYDGKGQDFRL